MKQNKSKIDQLQLSFEMMIITSVIISFSVVGLGVYNHFAKTQNIIYSSFINNTLNTSNLKISNLNINKNFNIYGSIANVTYINQSNNLQIIFSSPNKSNILIKILNNSNFISIPKYYNSSISGIGAISFSIIPKHIGINIIKVLISIKNSSNIYKNKNLSFKTYSILNNKSNNQNIFSLYFFSIIRHNESILYHLDNQQKIYTVSIKSKCTWLEHGEGIPTINLCKWAGAPHAKYYFDTIGYNCWHLIEETYVIHCISLNPRKISYFKISNNFSYFYNITLNVNSNLKQNISTNFSYPKDNKNIYLNNKIIGNIIINNISGEGQISYLNYIILKNSAKKYIINKINYNHYSTAFSSFNSTINQYKGTVDPNTPHSISSAMHYLNYESSRLVNSKAVKNTKCNLINKDKSEFYSCNPFSILNYNFIFNVYNKTFTNTTLDSYGSVLTIQNQKNK